MENDSKKCNGTESDTEDLKKAVDVVTDDSALSHEKRQANDVLEETGREAKKAEAFPTQDKSVTLDKKSS
jgi:hypothetical protein